MNLDYLAGIVDGEGTICAKVSNYKYYYCHIQVVNTYRPLLEAIQKKFSGTINIHDKHTKHPHWSPSWVWRLTGKRAEKLVRRLLPKLLVKRKDAMNALNDPRIKRGE